MQKDEFDFVIVGAGAAGLTAAQYGARSGLNTLVLDGSGAGGQALNINTLENYPGLYPYVSGTDFIQNMKEQAREFGAEFRTEKVKSIDKIDHKFVLKTDRGTLYAWSVLVASGAEHKVLGCKGEKEFAGRGVSYCATCDGPFFKNKKIFIVGGGDSACEEAFFLSSLSDDVTLVHRRDKLRAQKAIQNKIFKSDKIKTMFNCEIVEIKGEGRVQSVVIRNNETGEEVQAEADAVFIFVGMHPRTELVQMLPKDETGYLITNYRMETVVKGLYAAGDVRAKAFRQVVTACGDGALAAHQAHEYVQTLKLKMKI